MSDVAKAGTLAEIEIVDWQVTEGSDEELTDAQKLPWKVAITEGTWGALIEFTAPDGSTRHAQIEVKDGNPRVLLSGDGETVDAVATLCRDHVHVAASKLPAGRRGPQAVVMGEDGMAQAGDEPRPDLHEGLPPTP